jgi:hypothetical protein
MKKVLLNMKNENEKSIVKNEKQMKIKKWNMKMNKNMNRSFELMFIL